MHQVVQFLTENPWGILILTIATGLLSSLVYDLCKLWVKRLREKLKYKTKINKLKDKLFDYAKGYTTGYAHTSTYRQIVHVGNHIVYIIYEVGRLIFATIIFVALLTLVSSALHWLVIVFYTATFVVLYKKLKSRMSEFTLMSETVFGPEFRDKQINAMKDFAEETLKENKEEKNHN